MTAARVRTPAMVPGTVCGGDVVSMTSPDVHSWEHYLDRWGSQGLYHRCAWDSVFATYGLPVVRLAATRDNHVVGVLSLVRQTSRLFGDRLVSLPWFDAAGILADDEEAARSLVNAAMRYADSLGVQVVEVRQIEPADLSPHVRTDKVLMQLSLENDSSVLWNRLKSKVRNQIRKGEKSGLDYMAGGGELLHEFFHVYSINMRDLGSPCHSMKLFAATLKAFSGSTRVHLVRKNGQAVGGGLTISSGGTMVIPWASSLRAYNTMCVNHFLYWQILKSACDEGYSWFHFGRSTRDSGTWHFKRQWGAEEVPLYWYALGKQAGRRSADPTRGIYRWAGAAWRRLPHRFASRLGPYVISRVS